jgi:hypothetical protein
MARDKVVKSLKDRFAHVFPNCSLLACVISECCYLMQKDVVGVLKATHVSFAWSG